MHISVTVTGDKVWKNKLTHLSKNMGKIAVRPAFKDLEGKLMRTLNELFQPTKGKGKKYAHGYTGTYRSGIKSTLGDTSLIIRETVADGGRHIREGTSPQSGDIVIPYGVVLWAMDKLGVEKREAFAIARSVAMHGIGRIDGESPLPSELPVGESRIAFPTWVVTVKNKQDVEALAAKIGGLMVTYLDK
jgi:hypothetical protein